MTFQDFDACVNPPGFLRYWRLTQNLTSQVYFSWTHANSDQKIGVATLYPHDLASGVALNVPRYV